MPSEEIRQRDARFLELAALGATSVDVCRELGVSRRGAYSLQGRLGVKLKRKPYERRRGPVIDERVPVIAALYRDGRTLQEIGNLYGISRERVRQIISRKTNVTSRDGGQSVATMRRREQQANARDRLYLAKCGCTWDQYKTIRLIGQDMVACGVSGGRTPLRAYMRQRQNAKNRGISWEINLWQWWMIWQASEKWHLRGRGDGYVMCRKGDIGPYHPENVFIATARENTSSAPHKKSDLPMGVKRRGGRFEAHRCVAGKKLRLGSFDSADKAHGAYLASLQADAA